MTPIWFLLSTAFPVVDSVCVNLSSTVKTDSYLHNHLFGVLKKPSMFDCAVSCQAHIECLSFGFEPRKRLCHLHTEEESDAPDDVVTESPWIHGDIPALPKELWGPCADHNCTGGQKCTTNRVTKQAVCVKGDTGQQETHCPVPTCLDNANISSGGRKPGDSRTYTCQDGYLDTESFLSSGVATCLPDFTWSPTNLTCSGPYVRKITRQSESCQNGTFQKVIKDSKLVFFCKSCSNCVVTLCQHPEVSKRECYVVAVHKDGILVRDLIGGQTPRIINKSGLLSCDEFRPFWISWLDGNLAVGNGSTVGSQEYGRINIENIMVIKNLRLGINFSGETIWLLLQQN